MCRGPGHPEWYPLCKVWGTAEGMLGTQALPLLGAPAPSQEGLRPRLDRPRRGGLSWTTRAAWTLLGRSARDLSRGLRGLTSASQ